MNDDGTKPLSNERVFTPRGPRGARLRLSLSDADWKKIKRGHPWEATVTDENTGLVYSVRGAACGSSTCFCDAVVLSAINPNPEA